ncbi:DNA-binding transcriptional LysR family regulator [Rhizobium sp. BK529]|uniref:LysR substrate-binding domain-containing protein n=1 Tax=Rhizobium sp. BK529 TaxID=2586983 RepID=UPI0016202E3E|nr:LysR substrate-binding domain-containing protein [Rhizobium sp. BK529]MBB3595160.1 DNA-binding transcriptional LysR family regulator [Rhizobium sp. BK529]
MSEKFKRLDLNLLRVFNTLMEEESVLQASRKLNLTQSAVSHSLARLRNLLEDEIFVRVGSRMRPTERALELAPIVRNSLYSLEVAIEAGSFDPATTRRTFTVAANDLTTMVLMPLILRSLKEQAPHIDLVIRPVTRIDLAEQIDLGKIDVAIGTFATTASRFRSEPLFSYDDVLITAAGVCAPMTLDQLQRMTLCVVSFGSGEEGEDGYLSERGLARRSDMFDKAALAKAYASLGQAPRVGLVLPHFLALPALLAVDGYAAIVPRQLGQFLKSSAQAEMHEMPFPTAVLDVSSLWHVGQNRDPAHTWLRQIIHAASANLREEGSKPLAGFRS